MARASATGDLSDQRRELPDAPGVYVFRDRAGDALYVGSGLEEQGMGGWLSADAIKPDARIPPGQIDLALAKASPEPKTLDDPKLWEDWLRFLQGAAENGGLVVQ